MSLLARPGSGRRNQTSLAYVLAVLLPPLCSWLTIQISSLHSIPFALDFVGLAAVAALGGWAPSLLALIIVVVSRRVLFHAQLAEIGVPTYDPLRLAVLFVSVAVISVIGERRRRDQIALEEALVTLEDRTFTLIDSLNSSKCACWILDLDSGKSARWYEGSYPVFGRPFAEIEVMPSLRPLVHAEDQDRFPALVEHMRNSTEPVIWEYRSIWPNGELHWLEMRGTHIPGTVRTWRGVTLDITDRKIAETAVLRNEKLAAMGRLASTVAHEINNPLEAVTNLLYLARTNAALPEPVAGYIATAEQEVARLGNITRLTLGFVRSDVDKTAIDIAAVADDVLSIFQHRFETRSIQVERSYLAPARVQIPPQEFRQIVTNLVANAADAVSGPQATVRVQIDAVDATAVLQVDDNGSGISAEHLGRIFDPFFSTKQEVGTGIGLWVTRELVEKNGGAITAHSGGLPDGYQTRFRVELPLADRVS